jgi:hypothetical protein
MENGKGCDVGQQRVVFGEPTTVEVQLHVDTYVVPARGSMIRYDEVERLLGMERSKTRFRTVTSAWRKAIFRDHGVASFCQRNTGFSFCSPPEQIDESSRGLVQGLRRVSTAVKKAARTPREALSPHETRNLDHTHTIGSVVLQHAARLNTASVLRGLPRPGGASDATPAEEVSDADAS